MGSPILSYELPTGQVENQSFQIPVYIPSSKGNKSYQISFSIQATQQETLTN
jgi:hypothetical protein